jgi:hypothetical protein
MTTTNYDTEKTVDRGTIIYTNSCTFCCHGKTCAIYDAFMDADIIANDYNVLSPGYDDLVYQVLASNCKAYDGG